MNRKLGYGLRWVKKKFKEAIAIFTLNVEEYPKSMHYNGRGSM